MTESLILAAGADPGRWQSVQRALGGRVAIAFSIDLRGTLDLVARERPGVLVLCSDLLDATVEDCLSRLQSSPGDPELRVIVIDERGGGEGTAEPRGPRWPRAVHLNQAAVADELLSTVRGLLAAAHPPRARRPEARAGDSGDLADFPAYRSMVLGKSPAVQRAVDMIRKIARVDVTVLLCGETGSGKELFARRIHCLSDRARGPFRAVSLPAVPNELFESLLFGHERGAFTGAVSHNVGVFEQASKGTLFLDEVSSLGLEAQPKLLRAIQEKEIERVGARAPLPCDVRIIAATNDDLAEAVRQQRFREDLYHRLSVVCIDIPPLRRRREDIPILVDFFLRSYAEQFRCEIPEVRAEAMAALQAHRFPGNVRELENRVQRALLLAGSGPLRPEDFLDPAVEGGVGPAIHFDRCEYSLAQVERAYIEEVVEHTGGNQSRAAQILEIDRKTLRAKLQRRAPAPTLQSVPA